MLNFPSDPSIAMRLSCFHDISSRHLTVTSIFMTCIAGNKGAED